MKQQLAKEIARRVCSGQTIGVGTGTTVDAALEQIGARVAAEKLEINVVPTSYQSAWRCQQLGLRVLYPGYCGRLAWGFDGADAVDDRLWAVKGKGGAMLKEKILAVRCDRYILIVDESKLVQKLGAGQVIPIEVVPEALSVVEGHLGKVGAEQITLRAAVAKHGPVITEAGNLILDTVFPVVEASLEKDIKSITGVVENGLFIGYATEVLVGNSDGSVSFKK